MQSDKDSIFYYDSLCHVVPCIGLIFCFLKVVNSLSDAYSDMFVPFIECFSLTLFQIIDSDAQQG